MVLRTKQFMPPMRSMVPLSGLDRMTLASTASMEESKQWQVSRRETGILMHSLIMGMISKRGGKGIG